MNRIQKKQYDQPSDYCQCDRRNRHSSNSSHRDDFNIPLDVREADDHSGGDKHECRPPMIEKITRPTGGTLVSLLHS